SLVPRCLAGSIMTRRKKDPLRPLTEDEQQALTRLGRSRTAPAAQVARAKTLLAVADGADYQAAARAVGRRSGDAVARLVSRFNGEGLDALRPRHGGGHPVRYDQTARERIVREAQRTPTPGADGTAPRAPPTPPGRSPRCRRRCAPPRMACRPSRRTPSGRSSTRPATAISAAAPGAPPARPSASARPGPWLSPTPTPRRKKADRGGVHAGRFAG